MTQPNGLLTISCLLLCVGCQGNDVPMMSNPDQAHNSTMDMSGSSLPDAADPNAPGMVRYSYICDNKPEKTVELPHVRFGAAYECSFESEAFYIKVRDDRVPIDFRLSIPYSSYHGPGTYMEIADIFSGTGFSNCEWPSIRVQDGNCPALAGSSISACCLNPDAPKNALSCSITVQEHSLTRVTGTFTCHVQADKQGPNSPFMCDSRGHADVNGSFDFGPKDCM